MGSNGYSNRRVVERALLASVYSRKHAACLPTAAPFFRSSSCLISRKYFHCFARFWHRSASTSARKCFLNSPSSGRNGAWRCVGHPTVGTFPQRKTFFHAWRVGLESRFVRKAGFARMSNISVFRSRNSASAPRTSRPSWGMAGAIRPALATGGKHVVGLKGIIL